MKNFRTILLCPLVAVCSLYVTAQTSTPIPLTEPDMSKPKLFSDAPGTISIKPIELNTLLRYETGESVDIKLGNTFSFTGKVVSAGSSYGGKIDAIVIRSTNYDGAVLTLSRAQLSAAEPFAYTGRIVSMKSGDLFELQNQNGQYSFIKKGFYELINE